MPPSSSSPTANAKPFPANTVTAIAASGSGAVSAQGITRNSSSRKLAANASSPKGITVPIGPIGTSSALMSGPTTSAAIASRTTTPQMPALPAVTTMRGTNRAAAASTIKAGMTIASSIRIKASPAWGATRSRDEG